MNSQTPPAQQLVHSSAGIFTRLFHPLHVIKWLRLKYVFRGTALGDAQLELYARILPSGFLHYGYFTNPGVDPQDISLADVEKAQLEYTRRVLGQVTWPSAPVMDVGCGMGGLARMLCEQGTPVVALTPDSIQAAHVRRTLPGVEVIESVFGKIRSEQYAARFGTVITAESLQYLRLHLALPIIDRILKPGGRWVICDYFRIDDDSETSGHYWPDFLTQLEQAGMRVVYEEDITPNILPTLAFMQTFGERFIQPLVEFTESKFQYKFPRLHYILTPLFRRARRKVEQQLQKVDPERFRRHKRYVLLAVERA